MLIRKASIGDHKLGQPEGLQPLPLDRMLVTPSPDYASLRADWLSMSSRFAFLASERWLGPSSTHLISYTVYDEVLYFIKRYETRIYFKFQASKHVP